MLKTFVKAFLPNPFDWMLKKTAKKGGKKVALFWNRGLGDIALGLFAMVERIKEYIPGAEITFLIRENLQDGFSMLEGVRTIVIPSLKRGEKLDVKKFIAESKLNFDLVIEKPNPTLWVKWQLGKVVPQLKWNKEYDLLAEKFQMSSRFTWIGVQVDAETNYGFWRNWPKERWTELFNRLEKINVKVVLFGYRGDLQFEQKNILDLRGKTNLFELLSIIKNKCMALVLPDSGISSMTYYLNESFPVRLVTLWADPNHGILKQAVPSPNSQLIHRPIVARVRDLSTVSVTDVMKELFPIQNTACIILAGGQGTRLGINGPKGLFQIAGKTLFQWICEKVPPHLPIAIMTSTLNHEKTVAYFEEENFFGLDIHFFQQDMLPFLDSQKQPMEIKGPNGNGSVFRSFLKSGLSEIFAKKGIDRISVVHVENPLADPFDPETIGYSRGENADVVVRCIKREESDPFMGVLSERRGKLEIIEYTELDESEDYKYAYSGGLVFDFSFFCKMGDIELPIHWVSKKISIGMDSVEVWKGEQFIFDALTFAQNARFVCAPREICYAPLKSKENISQVEKILRKGK